MVGRAAGGGQPRAARDGIFRCSGSSFSAHDLGGSDLRRRVLSRLGFAGCPNTQHFSRQREAGQGRQEGRAGALSTTAIGAARWSVARTRGPFFRSGAALLSDHLCLLPPGSTAWQGRSSHDSSRSQRSVEEFIRRQRVDCQSRNNSTNLEPHRRLLAKLRGRKGRVTDANVNTASFPCRAWPDRLRLSLQRSTSSLWLIARVTCASGHVRLKGLVVLTSNSGHIARACPYCARQGQECISGFAPAYKHHAGWNTLQACCLSRS